MRKTLHGPGAGSLDEGGDHIPHSVAVSTDHGSHVRVLFSGTAWPEGDLEHQVRTVLAFVEDGLADVGGSLDDVVMLRWYVREDVLSRETQARIHEVRRAFFDPPHYPASTMVGVASLLEDGMQFELEVEAEVPTEDWETVAYVGEDHEEVSGDVAREMLTDGESDPVPGADAVDGDE